MRAMVEQIPSMNQPQHKIVSIIGNMSHYGRADRHEVAMHLSDRVGSQAYPVPTPVVATSIEERELLQSKPKQRLLELATLLGMPHYMKTVSSMTMK